MLRSSLQERETLILQIPQPEGWGSFTVSLKYPATQRRESTATFRLGDSVAFSRSLCVDGIWDPGPVSASVPYSYLRASIGSSLEAFLAGHTPKINPTAADTARPVITAHSGTEAGSDGKIKPRI
jgi:hypothetical protein